MAITDYIKGAAKYLNATRRDARRLPVWVRFTSLVLAATLTGSVALGIPLHPSERGCNMPMQMPDCGHMGMEPSAPSVTATSLCCLLSCQEPGPTGSAFTVQRPSCNGAFLSQVALVPPVTLHKPLPQSLWLQSASFSTPDTYLKNLALLI